MKKKGVIIELRDQYTYVLSHNGKITKIKREYYHEIGQEIQLSLIPTTKLIPIVFVACAIVIAFIVNPFKTLPEVQALSYLSLSVNPGIVLKVDDNDQIVAVSYTNQEGQQIINEIDLVNRTLDDSVIIFIDYCFENGFFQNNNQIDINVISDNTERINKLEQQVQTLIQDYLKEHQVTVSIKIDEVTSSQQENAQNLGIPDTKMKLIDLILYYYPHLDKEKLARESVDDLIEYLEDQGYDEHMLDHLEDTIEENEKTNQSQNNDDHHQSHTHTQNISGEEAKRIALNAVNGTIDDVDYDHEDNVYEIKVKTDDHKEYEIKIDASSGKVIEIEED